jgi:hypothetical protein
MMESQLKNTYHCQMCGRVLQTTDELATPTCCGQVMLLAIEEYKDGTSDGSFDREKKAGKSNESGSLAYPSHTND